MPKKRLLDAVKAAVAARPPKPKNWFDRLPQDAKDELLAIKKAWQEGEIVSSANALAMDICTQCREAGIQVAGKDWIREWLSRD